MPESMPASMKAAENRWRLRRFGFNLDHGGVNGGLKVLVDNVQQNQGTQGHGQGYLGSLKALSPELIEDVSIINGPFSAEYGDFSGLGVVHIRQRESSARHAYGQTRGWQFRHRPGLPAHGVLRASGWSPILPMKDLIPTDPFRTRPVPSRQRQRESDAHARRPSQKLGFRFLFGRNDFILPASFRSTWSAQARLIGSATSIRPTAAASSLAPSSSYYSKTFQNGDTFKADGFVGRSSFDLFSNFTFYLNDPVHGDAFSNTIRACRMAFNVQYAHPHRIFGALGSLTSGLNFHDNQINVGLYSRDGRVPAEVMTRGPTHMSQTRPHTCRKRLDSFAAG